MSTYNDNFVFSWAEDRKGRMVHVDSVPNGLNCQCVCPCCKEPLVARQGKSGERAHGFAHHSKDRMANLEICYMVVLYKLAEQIVQESKKIKAPSYYGIFQETTLEFVDVQIDNRYDRNDKQPDIIANTVDNKQYIIEFNFDYKVQRKKDIDYNDVSCLQIDLYGQSLDTIEHFLMNSTENRKWVNNTNYFNTIEERYRKAGKEVRIVSDKDCNKCPVKHSCCAVRKSKYSNAPLLIMNNNSHYRLCKTMQFNEEMRFEEERKRKLEELEKEREIERTIRRKAIQEERMKREAITDNSERSCYNCVIRLAWGDRNGMVRCGKGRMVNPSQAEECRWFNSK